MQINRQACHTLKAIFVQARLDDPQTFYVRHRRHSDDTGEAWAVKLRDQRHIADLRGWKDHDGYKKSFERVLRDLKRAAE